jgi:hypothetical protein
VAGRKLSKLEWVHSPCVTQAVSDDGLALSMSLSSPHNLLYIPTAHIAFSYISILIPPFETGFAAVQPLDSDNLHCALTTVAISGLTTALDPSQHA